MQDGWSEMKHFCLSSSFEQAPSMSDAPRVRLALPQSLFIIADSREIIFPPTLTVKTCVRNHKLYESFYISEISSRRLGATG